MVERTRNERMQREIDFVVNDGDRCIYVQSAYQMDIPHNFYDDNGFYQCNLVDLLLAV